LIDVIAHLNAALEGRYSIERQLGEGGTATVYLARDERHGRRVAVKVLKPDLSAVVGADRFLAEVRTTAGLQHPNILPLHDSGEAGPFLYYVMPYVEGESLRDRMDRERQLPVDDAVRVASDVAEALDYAHRQNVVHRDVKPENILLHEGRALIADFGIALAVRAAGEDHLTRTGVSVGTPRYMSPEQLEGRPGITGRSDIYSLGVVFYEMLAGEPPHARGSPWAILTRSLARWVSSGARCFLTWQPFCRERSRRYPPIGSVRARNSSKRWRTAATGGPRGAPVAALAPIFWSPWLPLPPFRSLPSGAGSDPARHRQAQFTSSVPRFRCRRAEPSP
jgi:serine/threonine protein kinase